MDEALHLLVQHGDEAKVLAGGQSLIPMLNFRLARPGVLIDLNRIPSLAGLRRTSGALHVGAMTRLGRLEREDSLAAASPLLAAALPHVAHPQIRNRGTLGGNLAHADPAAELPAVMLALNAAVHVRSERGTRRLVADEFFTGLFATALAPDELLVEVELPAPAARTAYAFDEVARRHGDFALMGIALAVTLDERGSCTSCRIVAVNTSAGASHLRSAEASLIGGRLDATSIAHAAAIAANEIEVTGDVHATPAYRQQLARVLTGRVLSRALSSLTPAC